MPNRSAVEADMFTALRGHDLEGYTDGVMDSLDTVVEWDDEDDDDH